MQYLVEETYELIEAIESGDREELIEELGDVLYQVLFHADIEAEAGSFTLEDVAAHMTEKMVARHPHVFGDVVAETPDEVVATWDRDQGPREVAPIEHAGRHPAGDARAGARRQAARARRQARRGRGCRRRSRRRKRSSATSCSRWSRPRVPRGSTASGRCAVLCATCRTTCDPPRARPPSHDRAATGPPSRDRAATGSPSRVGARLAHRAVIRPRCAAPDSLIQGAWPVVRHGVSRSRP